MTERAVVTTEPEQAGDSGRRKFDDVASLFGAIVPGPGAPGAPLRSPATPRPLPALLPDPSAPTATPPAAPAAPVGRDPAVESSAPPQATSALRTTKLVSTEAPAGQRSPVPVARLAAETPIGRPPAPTRPPPKEIPWPDAFEPRQNYRKPEPRNYSWLLLVPVGLVVAYGVTMLDTRALRTWIDANVLGRSQASAGADTLLPGPFRRDWVAPGPVPGFSPDADTANRTPALPTSPAPAQPGAAVTPPPAAQAMPSSPAAPSTAVHITINFRRGIPGAEGEARRLAALLQSTGGSIELKPATTTATAPTIEFYNPVDRAAAAALAASLANEAPNWALVQGSAKNPPGSIDVLMP